MKGYWKFILTVSAAIVLFYAGLKAYTWINVMNYVLKAERPGKINLVAITPGKGYRVIVANRVAQLGEVEESNDNRGGFGGQGIENASNLKRIPIRELLGSLDGDPSALGKLIERMNDLLPPDEPPSAYVWKAEDIEKAIKGDAVLRKKLELDLQTTLEGKPIESFSVSRVMSGILVDAPAQVEVNVGGTVKTIEARVRQKLQTRLAASVEKEINTKFNPTENAMLGIYITKGQEEGGKLGAENVVESLRARYSKERMKDLASKPERVVGSAFVLVNENHFRSASLADYKTNDGKTLSDITINVTDEGRKRLWKYSSEKHGFQLMLIVDGVAIAAPKIATELAESSVKIIQMPDPPLAHEAVDNMNLLAGKGK